MYPFNYQYPMYPPSDMWYQQQYQQYQQQSAIVKVEHEDQWKEFGGMNEMIVCKKGRSIFPLINYTITDIDQYSLYTFTIKMERIDDKKYRYTNGEWREMSTDKDIVIRESREVRHIDGYKSGRQWMDQGISFNKLKITNNMMELASDNDSDNNDKKKSMRMILQTMVKYQPVLSLIQMIGDQEQVIQQYRFDCCQFITVTGYQDTRISKLKTELNKYAKGYREGSKRLKRKMEEEEKKEGGYEYQGKKMKQDTDTVSDTNTRPLQPINQSYPMYPQYNSYYPQYYY